MEKADLKTISKNKSLKPRKVKNGLTPKQAREEAQAIVADFIKRIEGI